jgi:hypothetical protein
MRQGCPGKPGAGNPHAGFYLGGETQGRPRSLSTNHTIPHRRLIKAVKKRVADKEIHNLLWKFLHAGAFEQDTFMEILAGTPQGGIASPLLGNIYLHEFDQYMESKYLNLSSYERRCRRKAGKGNYLYVRYADDCARRKPLDLGDERSPPGDSPDAPQ